MSYEYTSVSTDFCLTFEVELDIGAIVGFATKELKGIVVLSQGSL